jgi:hypothetical protein
MDGGRRRRKRAAADDLSRDQARAAWYAWWRSARFAEHFGGQERPHPGRFASRTPAAPGRTDRASAQPLSRC